MTDTATAHRPPLGTHRLLGEGGGAALITVDGEIDWWCPDRFDAVPAFWSLLDAGGGRSRWRGAGIATWDPCPAGPTSHTTTRLDGQRVDLWDGLLAAGDGSALVRLVRTSDAALDVTNDLSAGGFDAPSTPWRLTDGGLVNGYLSVRGEVTVRVKNHEVELVVEATPGEWHGFAVCTGRDTVRTGSGEELVTMMQAAEAASERAMARIRLPRDHPSRATDALRVLRALTERTSGAPVAAPTTSLPEAPGGERQFDYRYSWLRDSGLALVTAAMLGQVESGSRYLHFVVDLVDRVGRHLEPLTTATGDSVPIERTVAGIAGWAGSRPVRVGNAAREQKQLDAVATVIDAIWSFGRNGGSIDRHCWAAVDGLATLLAESPVQPTSGIWEFRAPRLLVSEELARWQGLDRALRLRRRYRPWVRRPDWRRQRREARSRVESVVDAATGRLPMTFEPGDTTPDAATLNVAIAGFWRRRDRRLRRLVLATIEALEEASFLRRYPPMDDGFDGTEAAFVPASWWAVTALAAIGEVGAARSRADALCAVLPPLQPEQWQPATGEALGNTPLLWTHAESARSLYVLQRAELRRRIGPVGVAMWEVGRRVRVRWFTPRA